MFTGIIATTGNIARIQAIAGDWRLTIRSEGLDLAGVQLGDSIAVSGVCLTAVALTSDSFTADVSRETLACTTLQHWREGDLVNLELAMQPQSRLGGHIVSGHVDGVAELINRTADARSERLTFRVPAELARYIAHKGSVCIDGISLTVNEAEGNVFGVNIIPHTAQRTTMHLFKPGRQVNVEVDVIARYLERLLQGNADNTQGLTLQQLAQAGFVKA
jgi:riboflavin synthase